MQDDYEITLCQKTERVCIFKLPLLSTSQGHYFDSWKEMLWEGGLKLVEKHKRLTLTFIDKNGKVFASSVLPNNPEEAIVKTVDSSRGYAVRLEKPNGGFFWVGVVFRDRNDAFDFGVAFKDFNEKNSLSTQKLKQEFSTPVDFSLKKGEKVKIDIGKSDKPKQSKTNNDFNLFSFEQPPQAPKTKQPDVFSGFSFDAPHNNVPKPANTSAKTDWFSFDQPKKQKKEVNLLDL